MILGFLNIGVILCVINFAELGNTWLIAGLVGFSLLLSAFLGVYRGRSAAKPSVPS